jgi:hypothetical protein
VVFREAAKKDAKFIEWKAVDGKFEVSLRKNSVFHAINKMGKFILLYRGEFSWTNSGIIFPLEIKGLIVRIFRPDFALTIKGSGQINFSCLEFR